MTDDLAAQQRAYAELIIRGGVNLHPGQALYLTAELVHREFVRLLVKSAYEAGARHVEIRWSDPLISKARYRHIDPQHLTFVPDYETTRYQEMLDTDWAYIALVGSEYPDALQQTAPALIRREHIARATKLQFWQHGVMNSEISWCVAAVPTVAWASKVFPDLEEKPAVRRLWQVILQVCRADRPDPLAAWARHDADLKQVASFMDRHQIRTIRYLDETPGPDGRASTDLTVGLTERPTWICGSSVNGQGRPFYANIPTEEIFSTPDNRSVAGWVRTSKPGFPFQQRVENAYFRFEAGKLVEWSAETGREALEQLFQVPGARQLGELALVDVRSPINQSGLIFHEVLFDENAVCHIAFGLSYPEGIAGGRDMTEAELKALGANYSNIHEDLMIGTDAMCVIGAGKDGRRVVIMERGQFTPQVLA